MALDPELTQAEDIEFDIDRKTIKFAFECHKSRSIRPNYMVRFNDTSHIHNGFIIIYLLCRIPNPKDHET